MADGEVGQKLAVKSSCQGPKLCHHQRSCQLSSSGVASVAECYCGHACAADREECQAAYPVAVGLGESLDKLPGTPFPAVLPPPATLHQ